MEIALSEALAFAVVAVAAAAVLAPLTSDHLARWVLVPSVVLEIVLGVLLGPDVLGLVEPHPGLAVFAQLGMAVLFFLAGFEIEVRSVAARPVALAGAGWAASFLLALGLAAAFGAGQASLIVAIAIATTALGTILPIASDAGVLDAPVGSRLMAVGAIGEFAPIVLLALLFASGEHSGRVTIAILIAGMAVAAAALGRLRRSARVSRMLASTLGTSAQFAIRLSILAMLAAVLLAAEVGVDIALGAFSAGIVMRFVLAQIEDEEVEQVKSKLDGIGFGWLIPVFFVYTGVTFDAAELFASPAALALVPVFLAAFALVRGAVTWLVFARDLAAAPRRALAWFAATELPIVVIAAEVAAGRGLVSDAVQASMVCAAMLSVLLFPLLALRAARQSEAQRVSA